MSIYGSIHTHFESQYDTGNEKKTMLQNFINAGAKRVAVTEHGVFSSYEDLKDTVSELKKEAKDNNKTIDFDIIPGVEGYFEEDAAHIVLIAKDYDGYLSLCKIISESNKNIVKGKPIITLENLKQNVRKGHLICTTACIAGPFGRIFGLNKMNALEKINKLQTEIENSGYREYISFINEYDETKKRAKTLTPTKTARTAAEKVAKKTGDRSVIELLNENEEQANTLKAWLLENENKYKQTELALKEIGSAKFAKKQTNYEKYIEQLDEIQRKEQCGEIEVDANILLEQFTSIFGEKDFYFELQNHGLDKEKEIYKKIVKFAINAGHFNFIASNDIHIGLTKEDPNYEKELLRRNVMKFTRFNTYEQESEDDREYVIKSNEELSSLLKDIIPDIHDGFRTITSEEIVNNAIENIQNTLEECNIKFPENENHYPKFCEDENAEFERKVREGIKKKFPNGFPEDKKEDYEKRLEYEIDIIKKMGYAGYHLIVADYLEYGRLLGYLPTDEEIENAPTSIEELNKYIDDRGYPRIGYAIGPGRGSAVGSLSCFALGITDIDPIPYDLLFERFLNVERVSMPDIDSDFKMNVRGKTIEYCKAKYGAECICQIMTKSYGSTKGNLRLAARYLGTKEYEEKYGELSTDILLEKELDNLTEEQKAEVIEEENPKIKDYLKSWYNSADKLSKYFTETKKLPTENLTNQEEQIIDLANKLEGVFTNYGEHAAGTIISGDDLTDIIPLKWNAKKKSMETQCTMAQAEAKGLLKMDFLGLKNLDIITDVINNPTKTDTLAKALNIETDSPLSAFLDGKLQNYEERNKIIEDKTIYRDIFSAGLTQGVFQFASSGMKNMLMKFKPDCFEDIILLVAAYRPGPMDYIPEIIASKWFDEFKGDYKKYSQKIREIYPFSMEEYLNKKKNNLAYFYDENGNVLDYVPHSISLKNKTLDKILGPTYGCPIYQEQIMRIFQDMAGYSLGGADIVRRYMSKKKREKLVKEKDTFIYGDEERSIPGCCKLHGITPQEAETLFEQLMPFAEYGFNKSHATAYAMVALFTAYLKKYHTADFYRSCLNWINELKEIPDYVSEMPNFGIEFQKPSMRYSKNPFSVEDNGNSIRFGLQYIKGFSEQNVLRDSCIYYFLLKNPNVSLKLVEKYAQLGMFTSCWPEDVKTNRVHENRHECLRWINENGDLFQKYKECAEKVRDLESQKEELTNKLLNATDKEEEQSIQKELSKISRMCETWTNKRIEKATILNNNKKKDLASQVPKETEEEVLENRKWEIEYLSLPFDVESSYRKIKNCTKTTTFDDLLKSAKELNKNKLYVPAIVLSVSDKKTTKSGKEYYEVMLMDKNRKIITRRFDDKINVLEGDFELTLEDGKFFTCKKESIKPIFEKKEHKTSYLPPDATNQDIAISLKNGGEWKNPILPGRINANIFTNCSADELERE